jgi:hypothetical protein
MTNTSAAVLLSYNLNDQRACWVDEAARRLGFNHRQVQPAEYGVPLLSLVVGLEKGTIAPSAENTAPLEGEMLVLARFPPAMTNAFLDAFRQDGIPSVRLKAMLTETNSQWDSVYLYRELQQEAAHFARLRQQAQQKEKFASVEEGEGIDG